MILTMARPFKYPRPAREELVQLYEIAKLPLAAIAERYGVSEGTAARWMRVRGIPMRKRADHSKEKAAARMTADGKRICTGCGDPKPLTEYWRTKATASGWNLFCKACVLAERKNPRERLRDRHRTYGLECDEYRAMWESQNGKCPICDVTMKEGGRGPDGVCVDHCHDTVTVRGLTCRMCNFRLGYFRDDPDRTRRAAAYVEHYLTNPRQSRSVPLLPVTSA